MWKRVRVMKPRDARVVAQRSLEQKLYCLGIFTLKTETLVLRGKLLGLKLLGLRLLGLKQGRGVIPTSSVQCHLWPSTVARWLLGGRHLNRSLVPVVENAAL